MNVCMLKQNTRPQPERKPGGRKWQERRTKNQEPLLPSHPSTPLQFLRLDPARFAGDDFDFLSRHPMGHVGMSSLPAAAAFDFHSAGSHRFDYSTLRRPLERKVRGRNARDWPLWFAILESRSAALADPVGAAAADELFESHPATRCRG